MRARRCGLDESLLHLISRGKKVKRRTLVVSTSRPLKHLFIVSVSCLCCLPLLLAASTQNDDDLEFGGGKPKTRTTTTTKRRRLHIAQSIYSQFAFQSAVHFHEQETLALEEARGVIHTNRVSSIRDELRDARW